MEKYHQELGNEIIMNTHLVHRSMSTDNIQSNFLWLADGTEAELKTDLLIARFFLKCLVAYASQTGKHSLHFFFSVMRFLFSSASERESQPLVDGFIPSLYWI